MRNYLVLCLLGLAAVASAALAATPPASHWEIGPIIRGKNYSVGMPLQPTPTRNGWTFDFPYDSRADGHVHYVTFTPGPLTGKSRIVVRYRVESAPGTRFVPQEQPHLPGTVSLFLQRRGDNWSAKGRYAFYRWYAPAHTVQQISRGVHQMTVALDDPQWVAVVGGINPSDSRGAFIDALEYVDRVGLVFGSTSARGHGVFATAPARFELLSFSIE